MENKDAPLKIFSIEINDKELEGILTEWFARNGPEFKKSHFIKRNPVAMLLKRELTAIGRWKVKNRGKEVRANIKNKK